MNNATCRTRAEPPETIANQETTSKPKHRAETIPKPNGIHSFERFRANGADFEENLVSSLSSDMNSEVALAFARIFNHSAARGNPPKQPETAASQETPSQPPQRAETGPTPHTVNNFGRPSALGPDLL